MAKNYRREKIVKAIKRIETKRKNFKVRSPSDSPAVIKIYELFAVLADDIMADITSDLLTEFDIKEEEIT